MSSVVIAGNTSGTITLDAPNVAGTTVLTLPTTSGTVVTTNTMPTGSVLQVVQATYSTAFNTGSTTYVDTGLSASITPSSSSSKILVLVNQGGFLRRTSTNEQCGYVNLVRGSTQVTEFVACKSVSGYVPFFNGINYLDSPNTTSSTTYKTQTKVDSALDSGLIYFQSGNLTSTIILMEIKG